MYFNVASTVHILSWSAFCTDMFPIFIASFLCFRLVLLSAVARKSIFWCQNLDASGSVVKVRFSWSTPWRHIGGVEYCSTHS